MPTNDSKNKTTESEENQLQHCLMENGLVEPYSQKAFIGQSYEFNKSGVVTQQDHPKEL